MLIGLSVPSWAQMNYYNATTSLSSPEKAEETEETEDLPPVKNFTVTSLKKCYAQLSRDEVVDIQKNYIKPYQECQRRVALKLQKKQTEKAADVKEKSSYSSDGFFRVQKQQPAEKSASPKKHLSAEDPSEKGDLPE